MSRMRAGLTALGMAWGLTGLVQAREVSLCVDPEPPPSAYWERDAEGRRTDRLTGATVELLSHVFAQIGLVPKFVAAPWARCMRWAATGEVDFAVGGYQDEERAKTYAFSIAYRAMTPQIYSLRDTALRPQSLQDLKPLHGCGLTGASYAHYGLKAGSLDQGVGSYQRLIQKLTLKRCDYFPDELEMVEAVVRSGQVEAADAARLFSAPAPWARGPTRHLLAARDGAAAALLPRIDPALLKALQDGLGAELWRKHGGRTPYQY